MSINNFDIDRAFTDILGLFHLNRIMPLFDIIDKSGYPCAVCEAVITILEFAKLIEKHTDDRGDGGPQPGFWRITKEGDEQCT